MKNILEKVLYYSLVLAGIAWFIGLIYFFLITFIIS